MARGSDTLSRVASVADYNSDDGEIAGTRKQANVAAKRSGGLGKDAVAMTTPPPQHVAVPDLSSDSGYSARTHATFGSTDSDQSAPLPSEVHTATSSNSHDEDIVIRHGKKYKVCRDPNCTKSHHPKKSGKPPKSHAMSPPREKSPDERPQLRQRAATAGEARHRPNSMHAGMAPHGYLPPPHPTNPYWMHQAHMVINRNVPPPLERPGPPHRSSEWSTRRVAPPPYYAEPLPKQKAKVVISMRKPTETPPPTLDEEAYEAEVDRRLRLQKEKELDELDRERKSLQAEWRAVQQAWQHKQQADRAAMPPPPLRSAMRRPSTVAPPKVTYDDDDNYGPRYRPPSIPPPKTYSHERGYDPADAQRSVSKYRPKSLVSNDPLIQYATSRLIEDAEFGRRQRELAQVNNARASRESQTVGGDSDGTSDRLDGLTLDQSTRPKVDSKINAAENYMGRSKEESRYPLTERAMRKSGLDRDAASVRSKRIPKDGSATTATGVGRHRSVRSNSSSRAPEPTPSVMGAAAGFQLRIDTQQKYDLEVGEGQHISLHPTPEGTMNLVYHGTRETPYPSTRASTSTTTGSRVGRSFSQRSAAGWRARGVPSEVIVDDDDEDDDDDDEDDDDDDDEEEEEMVPPPRRPRTARPSETRRATSRDRRWAQEEEQRKEQRRRQQLLAQQQQQREAAAAAATARRPAGPTARRMSRREDERPVRPALAPLAQGGERRTHPRVRQAQGGYVAAPTPPPGSAGPYSAPPGPPPNHGYGQDHGYFGGGGNYHGFGA
jgi:hypothetical protein